MSKCANCGWDWFKHSNKNQCPHSRPNADGSKPRFTPLRRRRVKARGETVR